MNKIRRKKSNGKSSFLVASSIMLCLSLLIIDCGGGAGDSSTNGNTYSVTLAWDAPTQREDGSPLSDLAGYILYYGPSAGQYTHSMDIGNTTIYTIENLPSGTFFFSVTAYDSFMMESDYSQEISAQFD